MTNTPDSDWELPNVYVPRVFIIVQYKNKLQYVDTT